MKDVQKSPMIANFPIRCQHFSPGFPHGCEKPATMHCRLVEIVNGRYQSVMRKLCHEHAEEFGKEEKE